MRLNGWQRIGLVTSIVWFIAGGLWGNKIALDEVGARTSLQLDACVAENKRRHANTDHTNRSGRRAGTSLVRTLCVMRRDIGCSPHSLPLSRCRLHGSSPTRWSASCAGYGQALSPRLNEALGQP
jgi:hypothetical protein